MTRRKRPPPPNDPDDYGFDTAGKGFKVTPAELLMLLGVDTITCALYMRCLKPFADRLGYVSTASYYRFQKILSVTQSPAGGPRVPSPSKDQLRRALTWLQQSGLIVTHLDDNCRDKALQIWVQKQPSRKSVSRG